MMKNKQAELIKNMDDKVLVLNVWLTQLILLVISVVLGFFLFDHFNDFCSLFEWNDRNIIIWGVSVGIGIVLIDLLLMKIIPSSWYDDGGINERIFSSLPIWHIFLVTLAVAVGEEILFRGVIQHHTNIWIASIIFAIVHYRYLFKPYLFINVTVLSLFIGFIFQETNNLMVTITAHFLIDFLLGLYIRLNYLHKIKN
ncbi:MULTISPECIES: CPBP family intramembrane glutamic endopeptidase [Bacillus]|uniref:CPBP family intramembrane glutamic endopeptidase n=1 Tax=Bacillus TaxID=1386 RepID=UPI00037AC940